MAVAAHTWMAGAHRQQAERPLEAAHKAADRAMTIETVRLEEKDGGKSGHFTRETPG